MIMAISTNAAATIFLTAGRMPNEAKMTAAKPASSAGSNSPVPYANCFSPTQPEACKSRERAQMTTVPPAINTQSARRVDLPVERSLVVGIVQWQLVIASHQPWQRRRWLKWLAVSSCHACSTTTGAFADGALINLFLRLSHAETPIFHRPIGPTGCQRQPYRTTRFACSDSSGVHPVIAKCFGTTEGEAR